MGVFKNDVGRPTNKIKTIRNIFKIIGLLLIVGIAFFAGYYLDNNQSDKDKQNVNVDKIPEKYKHLNFVTTTEVDYNLLINDVIEGVDVYIDDGIIKFKTKDEKILNSEGVKNVKYIATFNEYIHDAGVDFIALTNSGELYTISDTSVENSVVYFKKVNYSKKVKELLILDEFNDYNTWNPLYVLNEDDELLKVHSIYSPDEEYLIYGKYEERKILIGCSDGWCYNGEINVADKTIKLDNYGTSSKVKYNNKNVKVKYVFESWDSDYDNSKQTIYIITENYEIITPKLSLTGDNSSNEDCYEFIQYNNLKVKNIKEIEQEDYNNIIITYENGETETIKNIYMIYQ